MGKIYDITSKLQNEKPEIRIGDKIYTVDNSKNTVLKCQQLMKKANNEMDALDEVIKIILGESAHKEIENMDLSLPDYQYLFIAVMAAANNEEIEVMEKRFQEQR